MEEHKHTHQHKHKTQGSDRANMEHGKLGVVCYLIGCILLNIIVKRT